MTHRCLAVARAADELLEFALKRVDRFEHVGTTEKLYPSVESAAASLKMPLGGTAYGAGEVRSPSSGDGRYGVSYLAQVRCAGRSTSLVSFCPDTDLQEGPRPELRMPLQCRDPPVLGL